MFSFSFDGEFVSSKSPRVASLLRSKKTQTTWVFSVDVDKDFSLVWVDKSEWCEGSSVSLKRLSYAKVENNGLLVLVFPEHELFLKLTNVKPEAALRMVVEAAAAAQGGVTCTSLSSQYFEFSSNGFKKNGNTWKPCALTLLNGVFLIFDSLLDQAPIAKLDLEMIAAVSILGRDAAANVVLVELTLSSGAKRLFGTETKQSAEEWKKRLVVVKQKKPVLRKSGSNNSVIERETKEPAREPEDIDEADSITMEMPDLRNSGLEWGSAESVSQIETSPPPGRRIVIGKKSAGNKE